MKLVLHIGAHKSGSTAIQAFASRHQKELEKAGVYYPVGMYPDLPAQHSLMYYDLETEQGARQLRGKLESALSQASEADCQVVLLSGEDLSASDPGRVERFHRYCGELFTAVEIILVLRNKCDYIGSHYKHTLTFGHQTFFTDFPKRIQFSPLTTVTNWREKLGDDVVKILAYRDESPLLERFFHGLLGLDLSTFNQEPRSNASMDIAAAFFVNFSLKNVEACEPAVFNRHYFAEFNYQPPQWPADTMVAEQINTLYPDQDWIIDGIDWGAQKSGKEIPQPDAHQMADYFRKMSRVLKRVAQDLESQSE